MKKKAVILAMAGMLTVTSLTACGSLKGDETAITVGDDKITAEVANFYARYTQAQYETYYGSYLGDDMWDTEASEGKTYEESVKSAVQEDLEKMVLMEQHMKDYDISLSDKEKKVIENSVSQFSEDNSLESKDKVSGSEDAVKRVLTLLAIQEKMTEAIEAGADTEVSDEEAAQKSMQYVLFAYNTTDAEGNSAELSDDEKAALKADAETFAASAKEGTDFSQLAADQSLEVQTATFDEESTNPDADLVKAADALGEGETTDVFETDAGCYVAKVTSLMDKDATESKKAEIVQERKNDLYTKTCEEWKKDTDINVNKSVWKKIDFSDLRVTMKLKKEEPYANKVQTDDQADSQSGTSGQE